MKSILQFFRDAFGPLHNGFFFGLGFFAAAALAVALADAARPFGG